eukprot:3941429-Pleurochrysis_carterae.AAC.3
MRRLSSVAVAFVVCAPIRIPITSVFSPRSVPPLVSTTTCPAAVDLSPRLASPPHRPFYSRAVVIRLGVNALSAICAALVALSVAAVVAREGR